MTKDEIKNLCHGLINVLTSLSRFSLFLTLIITGVLDSVSNYEYIVIDLRDRDELSRDELFLRRIVSQRIVYATNCPRDELSATNSPRRIVLRRIVQSPS